MTTIYCQNCMAPIPSQSRDEELWVRLATVRPLIEALASYERFVPHYADPEPCDFCHNTTEHMPDCPVQMAREYLAQQKEERA